MIRSLVDFALNNRILVLSLAVLLFVWGLVSFHNLPIEAYPDVADTVLLHRSPRRPIAATRDTVP